MQDESTLPPRASLPGVCSWAVWAAALSITKCQLTDPVRVPQVSHQSQLKPFPVSYLGKQGHSSCSSCSGGFQCLHHSELDRCFVSPLAQLLGTNCFWFSTQIKSLPHLDFLIGKRPEANSRKIVPDSLSQSKAVTYLGSAQRMVRVRCFQCCLEKKDREVLMGTQRDVTLSCSALVQGYWAEQTEDIPYSGDRRSTPDILPAGRTSPWYSWSA